MNVTFFEDPRAHLAAAETFLLQERVFNMHQLRILSAAAQDVAAFGHTKDVTGGIVITSESGQVCFSALLTSRRGLFVSPLTEQPDAHALIGLLAGELQSRNLLTDVVGHAASARAVAQALGTFRPFISGTLYALTSAPDFDFTRATFAGLSTRIATAEDAQMVIAWQHAFIDELSMKDPKDQVADRVYQRIESGQIFLAHVNDEPAAYAGGTNVGHGIGSIGPVYTVPSWRNRGLKVGQAVTAFACAHVRTLGAETIVLLADAHNPVSNAAYQRIGFTARGEFLHLERVEPSKSSRTGEIVP